MRRLFHLFVFVAFTISGCAGSSVFPEIGAKMSNPITLAVDSTRSRLYVINSNYRVLYEDGSMHVVDISDPANPTRVNNVSIPSLAGEIYLDTTNLQLYTPNRMGSSSSDILFQINIDESSANFLSRTDYSTALTPYGITCCDAENRLLVASQSGTLDFYDLDTGLSRGSLDLTSVLSTGVTLSGAGALRLVIYGTQAVIVREGGGLWVVNLDELGVSGRYPVDYFIYDLTSPRGIAADGTYIYIADIEWPSNVETPSLFVLDISTLTPRTDNSTAEMIDKDDSGLVVADITLNNSNPQGLTLGNNAAYVAHYDANSVSVADLTNNVQTASVSVGVQPYEMAVYSPGGTPTHLFVANSGDNTVSVIDLTTNGVVATYP